MTRPIPRGDGLECSNCGGHILAVKDSRRSQNAVRRRRHCLGCGKRTTTYEIALPGIGDENRLVAALALFDKLRSVPEVPREALLRMINALATKSGRQPALAPPLIDGGPN